jgi:hypothetical protein
VFPFSSSASTPVDAPSASPPVSID